MNINEFSEMVKLFGQNIGKFCYENGINLIGRKFDLSDINVILYVSVERRNRTDEEIDMLIRQLKVMFMIPFPEAGLKIRYKVV